MREAMVETTLLRGLYPLRTPHNLVRATPTAIPPRRGRPLKKTTPPRTAEAVAMKISEVNTDLILSVIFIVLILEALK
jgi:hypothetical protein